MGYGTALADKSLADNGTSLFRKIAWGVAVFSLASGMAAWIADCNPVSWISYSASSRDDYTPSFDARFLQGSQPNSSSTHVKSPPLVQSMSAELEIKREQAKDLLAQRLLSLDSRAALIDELKPFDQSKPSIVTAIPVPRSRPVEAGLELKSGLPVAQAENRTLLQKLSDLLPARIRLASLAPDGGLFRSGPDLASLGYDNLTAVYDISARAVYMPDGSKLEAHSGLGGLMDDPERVSERNAGATPPNVYDLKPREKLFHGVQALRMIPVGDSGTLGRSGLLVHSYLLGPNGDSNGCVSIKDYETFLKTFTKGEIKRLVVVPSLSGETSASRRSPSES
ncbi:DUF2778 domain-containing protein [Bradyrhizobium sp. URHD0069]|uniref:DUF2778 domain-containing protein n=1 Tax=Bradyrhizobium sp. URHD0069 TaxID=1380355 RepID=UPI00068D1752|nr:DUF2778 domain-containing protein [Bradyrhizobium sp. URHD0069]